MIGQTPSLKMQNALWVAPFAICHSLAAAYAAGTAPDAVAMEQLQRFDGTKSFIALSASLLGLLLAALVGQRQKARSVYWRWHNPEPGYRAFTSLAPQDHRFDLRQLESRIGEPIPRSPIEQNQLWYKLYKTHSDDDSVISTHKEWLLFRELAWLALVGLAGSIVVVLFVGINTISVAYSCLALAVWAGMVIAARGRGERFVSTVLSVAAVAPLPPHTSSGTK